MNRVGVFVLAGLVMSSVVLAQSAATRPATTPTTQRARFGLSMIDANTVDPKFNGPMLALGGNLLITGTAWESRAEKLGFDIADVLKRVNGKEVKTIAEANAQIGKRGPLTFEIIRDGKTLTLTEPADASRGEGTENIE